MDLMPRTSTESDVGRVDGGRTALRRGVRLTLLAAAVSLFPSAQLRADEPMRVFATLPDLGSLASEVGGDRVSVVTMVRGPEDPHFAPARPSWVKELSRADVYIRDLTTGTATLVSVNAAGTDAGDGASEVAKLSADGTKVAFRSGATDLLPTPTRPGAIYVRDLVAGTTTLATPNAAGTCCRKMIAAMPTVNPSTTGHGM